MNWLARQFELARGGSAANVRPMEGLRGFAVFMVFLVHYVTLVTPWIDKDAAVMRFADGLHTVCNSGVDLFFVLSGFLIYGSLLTQCPPYGQFMKRRVRRIYPAFTVVFFIYLALSFAFPGESKLPAGGGDATVYLLQNFFLLPGLFPIDGMISVAWSLSYEMFFYLTMPLLVSAGRLRERTAAWRIGFFLAMAAGVLVGCVLAGGPYRMVMFFAGLVLFELSRSASPRFTPSSALGLTALVAGWFAMVVRFDGALGTLVQVSVLFTSFLILCLACFQSPTAWLVRCFSWTPLRWLGNMSYSYYLLHGLSLKASFLLLAAVLPGATFGGCAFWVLLPALFVVSLVPTAALFLLVERPLSLTAPRRESPVRAHA